MFLNNRRTLIGKTESTPYTGATLADADFNTRVKNITYSREIVEFSRKIALGDLDFSESIMGKQQGKVSFDVDLVQGSSASTLPSWSKFLTACGFKVTTFTTTGISWVPHAEATHSPITFEVQEVQEGASPSVLVVRLVGCVGTVKFSIGSVGEPIQMMFEFSGRLDVGAVDRNNASILDPTSLSTVVPPAVLGACVNVNSIAQDLDKLEIDIGNDVQMWGDPCEDTGIRGFYIAGRETMLTCDPFAKLVATEDVYGDWVTGNITDLEITLSTTPPLKLSAPKIQLTAVGDGDRNGALTAEKTFRLERNAGNDIFEILQGTKV